MDTSRFKRREIQTRPTQNTRLSEFTGYVPRGNYDVAQNSAPAPQPAPIAPVNQTPEPQYFPVQDAVPVQAAPQPVHVAQPHTMSPSQLPEPPVSYPEETLITNEAEVANLAVEQPSPETPKRFSLNMQLPGEASPVRKMSKKMFRGGKLFTKKRVLIQGGIALVVIVIGLTGVLFAQGIFDAHKVFKGGAPSASLAADVSPAAIGSEGDGRINVLILGRDGGGTLTPDITDSMVVDSIDPVNKTSTLISVPGDLWVDMQNKGAMKINSTYEAGEFGYLGSKTTGSTDSKAIDAGFSEADQAVESVLGVTVNYNVIVNYQAFQQAVDTVGGVTVNVPTALVDPTMAWQNGNNPTLANAGDVTLTGVEALNYVRSKETSSDFARAQRQRSVLIGIEDKIESMGVLGDPLKVSSLFSTFGDNVATDLSLNTASKLYGIIGGINGNNITSIGLADTPNNYVTTGLLDGQSIVLPSAGLFNYTAIQSYISSQLKDPYVIQEHAKVLVLNGTNVSGLATNLASQLTADGYDVIGAGNTPNAGFTQTSLVDLNSKDKYTDAYLEKKLNVKSAKALPVNNIATEGADFVIIIGANEANSSQN
jgi:LCP family protein required for cell wall assembly